MSDIDVAALRSALAKATAGDWHRVDQYVRCNTEPAGDYVAESWLYADAELIVLLRNNAEALLDELDATTQALWDVRRELGFDNDGDPTPAAQISGAGSVEKFAKSVVADAALHRDDYEAAADGIDNDLIHANARAQHWYERAQAAAEGVDMLVAQAERRGAVKALRWFEGNTDGLNHALLGTTWLETRDRANAIESGADL